MISIDRSRVCEPPILSDARAGDKRWKYREVREALADMQYRKCCYCEAKIETAGHGQAIEHFRPKGLPEFQYLENEWTNLLHACSECNGAKGPHFPYLADGIPALIDPSDPAVDPEDHIDFDVDYTDNATFARAKPKDASELGQYTICLLKLDNITQRRARYDHYTLLIRAYVDIIKADETTKRDKIQAFMNMLGANNEYAGFARAFARKAVDASLEIEIPKGAQCP